MFARIARLGLLAGALALAGCTATSTPGRVTRFHLGQPIAPGEVAVLPRDAAQPPSLEFGTYAAVVAGELTRLGFKVVPAGQGASEQIAFVEFRQATREGLVRRSPVTIGIGGGSFGGDVGVGVGTSFGVGKPRSSDTVVSELWVQLKRRSDQSMIWEGRAVAEARGGSADASPGTASARLAAALFRDFPGESGRTVEVK